MAKIDNMLKDEKILTKAELSSYKAENFQEFDNYLKYIERKDIDSLLAVKDACDQKLLENSESIVGRYISGSIGMIRRPFDENINMTNLLITFYDVHNWECVEFLCNKILSLNENKRALRMLADCLEETNRPELRWVIYERLVKVDIEEKKIVKQLAIHFNELGNKEKAIFYYKRALLRFLSSHDNDNAYLCFKELLALENEDFGYFLGMCDKAYTFAGTELAIRFIQDLLLTVTDNIDNTILLLKKELEYDPLYQDAKQQLLAAYKTRYASSKRYNYCMKVSGLNNPKVDINKAIQSFETDISYDVNSFVYQRSIDKVGKIVDINDQSVVIIFDGVGKKTMTLDMARRALEPMPRTNIKVLKLAPVEKLRAKFTSDINWGLKTLINSHNNKCSIKEMKADLTPSILTAKEWTTFLKDAKKELMDNPYFSNVAGENDTYMLRNTPITTEEKKLALFKSETDFYKKVQIIRDFVIQDGDIESESFMEMVKFFNDELKRSTRDESVTDQGISSYLLLDILSTHDKIATVSVDCPVAFQDLYKRIEDKVKTFEAINNPDLKKSYIDEIIECDKAWPQLLKQLFPYYTYSYIPEKLKTNGQNKTYIEILKDAVENYKDSADVLLWVIKNATEEDWEKAGIDQNRLLITQILLLDFTTQCVENKSNVTENKKRTGLLTQYLFQDKLIFSSIKNGNEENAQNLYSLIANSHIEPGKKIEVKHLISEVFPSFKFFDTIAPIDTSSLIPTGFLCTKAMLEKKKAELDHIQHVELPQVAEEIADARALGDLRENAEYQYGKDKQKNLNAMMKTLSDEIEKAQVITPDKVDPSRVGFGTKVTLEDKLNNDAIVSYSIFGQWESVPEENIINFKTPLGINLMNKTVGDEFKFDINGNLHSYKVIKIEALDF